MATTGKRYISRTQDRTARRIIDGRTRNILQRVRSEEPGQQVAAWLQAMGST